ncbi:ArsR/SmtB family transcription factor [Agromyces cerinus]|uniref:Regulatory protein, arsR family n=1 Tax=Agromyces cerinus subsp. cerinus TaxID=232089 RepID=A0A1N6HI40_9MICO|nr:metalloregulator ArsR/SmtB family transcription factor [Agromyces cerinus]SIO19359.1 regulatory protein, arsR family [Agromyces cerinus subsp. cerinus]
MTHAFEIVAQPIRRRIIEVLAVGDHTAGELCDVVTVEAGVSRTAVSHHLAALRDRGVVWSEVDPAEPRARRYFLDPEFLMQLDDAVCELFELWDHRYGTAQRRAPLVDPPRTRARLHRWEDAAIRRRVRSMGEWGGDGAGEPSH